MWSGSLRGYIGVWVRDPLRGLRWQWRTNGSQRRSICRRGSALVQSVASPTASRDEARSPPVLSQLMVYWPDICDQEGEWSGYMVDSEIRMDSVGPIGRWAKEDENFPLVLHPLAMEVRKSEVGAPATDTEPMAAGFAGDEPLGPREVSNWCYRRLRR
ncbi:hypothetical protein TEA_018443 [Camellia sinensis var. sinensis]|uniref:Uncharacterized protein n=1 Tax=Camellia sinensis var. sinensis TaxID=542762 RepID=A0A4S4D7G6_CAMSN|nr:hypothetical protein TEA_018443 [Camellia sinensis var. sinensis]